MVVHPDRPPNIDLHSHSTESDGEMPPAEVVREAARDGVTVLALTDHDTLTGIGAARAAAAEAAIELVAGVEVSCQHGAESVHLLGLFVTPDDPALVSLFAEVSLRRRERIRRTCQQLTDAGIPLTYEEAAAMCQGASLGRPHVADALVRKGIVRNRSEAFERYLGDGKAGHVPYGWKVELKEAVDMLHAAGGVSSIAHPKYLDDQSRLVPLLRESGVRAIEVYHAEQDAAERDRYLEIADSLGLLVTGGSDFHKRENGKRFGSDLPPHRYRELLAAVGG